MSCSELQVTLMNAFLRTAEDGSKELPKEAILKQIGFILWDHQPLVENCLELFDDETKRIRRIKSASTTRFFWKVPSQSFRGAQKKDYVCTEKFCSCRSFLELAKSTKSEILCKHLLAIRMGTALGMVVEQVVPDVMFVEMMCD